MSVNCKYFTFLESYSLIRRDDSSENTLLVAIQDTIDTCQTNSLHPLLSADNTVSQFVGSERQQMQRN
jgi:hypothetical protein